MRKLIINKKEPAGNGFFRSLPFCVLYGFHAELQVVADHGDEFAVGRLAAFILDRVAEIGAEHVHVAAQSRTRSPARR